MFSCIADHLIRKLHIFMFKHLIVIIPFCMFVYLQIPQNIWAFKSYQGLLIQPSGALDWTVGRPNSTLKLHQEAPLGGELTQKICVYPVFSCSLSIEHFSFIVTRPEGLLALGHLVHRVFAPFYCIRCKKYIIFLLQVPLHFSSSFGELSGKNWA